MAFDVQREDAETPDLEIAGFTLFVHGRHDEDGWLTVTARCAAMGATVRVRGEIITVSAIRSFGEECQAMMEGKAFQARLDSNEPELDVLLEAVDRLGHIRATVNITPDHLDQSHRMDFEIDLSYLPGIIADCAQLVRAHAGDGASGWGG